MRILVLLLILISFSTSLFAAQNCSKEPIDKLNDYFNELFVAQKQVTCEFYATKDQIGTRATPLLTFSLGNVDGKQITRIEKPMPITKDFSVVARLIDAENYEVVILDKNKKFYASNKKSMDFGMEPGFPNLFMRCFPVR
jgi:hypothetical protein